MGSGPKKADVLFGGAVDRPFVEKACVGRARGARLRRPDGL